MICVPKCFIEYFCLATIVGDNGGEGDIGAISVLILTINDNLVGQQIMMVVNVILVQVGWSGRSINHRWTPDVPAWNKPPPTVFYVLS